MTQSIGRPSHAAATPAEISSRKSLLVVALCWFAIFAEGYDVGVLGAILPALATDPVWKLTPLELGAMGSYTVIGMLIGGIVVGTLSELYGRKPLFMGCLSLFAACMIATSLAPTPFWFAVSRFVAGLGLGGIIPVAAALTVEYSPKSRKSFNYGLMYSGYSLGILAAALFSRGFLADYGWRVIVLFGAAPLLVVPVFYFLLPESVESLVLRGKQKEAAETARRMGIAVPKTVQKNPKGPGWSAVLKTIFARDKAFETICFWVGLFLGLLLVYGLAQWLPQIMRKNGYDLATACCSSRSSACPRPLVVSCSAHGPTGSGSSARSRSPIWSVPSALPHSPSRVPFC